MEFRVVSVRKPEETNVIIGQTHFIKTVEDIYEAMVNAVPGIKFGLAFCEASGARLVRSEGTDPELKKIAEENAMNIAAGHTFFIIIKDAYPINVLKNIKELPEVCSIFCATANPVDVIVVETERGRGVVGVIDGQPPVGIEKEEDIKWRKDLLRKIGYKL